MKPFHKLALAAAGAGLIAPAAASAGEVASLNGTAAINSYMQQQDVDRFRAWESQNQVTSVNQFSDVQPTDWAYQALANLIERYGCVAGYPDGSFKGSRAMTRYEAAALLNACLDRVTEVTDELKRLMAEFEKELAVLKGRVDGLEARVGEVEASQFSTTTKLKGESHFILAGSPDYDTVKKKFQARNPDGTTFNYDLRLTLDTSFTGKDLLKTRLRSGNFSSLPFGTSSSIFKLDKAATTDGNVIIDRLYYKFPVGDSLRVTVGPLARNTEMLSFIPSAYKSKILDFFQLAGASGNYNKATGAGAGISWRQQTEDGAPYITLDTNYVSSDGFDDSTTGVFYNKGGINWLSQLGIKGESWGAAVAYRHGTQNSKLRDANFDAKLGSREESNGVSIAAYWQPIDSGWVPSLTGGYGYTWGNDGFNDSQSWMVGLSWSDAFTEGNSAGLAFGMPPYNNNKNESWLMEVYYKFQVTDNISITPSLFYGSDPRQNKRNDAWGGVVQTTFKF